MTEEWRPVVGYEAIYEVSDRGRVRRTWRRGRRVDRVLRPSLSNGYPYVNLSRDGDETPIRIHRLVAFAFLGRPSAGADEVNHIDGVKLHNALGNLEWVTPIENKRHYARHRRENADRRIHCGYCALARWIELVC